MDDATVMLMCDGYYSRMGEAETRVSTSHVNPALVPGEHNVFLNGNHPDAKAQVTTLLIESLGWQADAVIELGDITTARGTEMLLPIWGRLFGSLDPQLPHCAGQATRVGFGDGS